MRCAGSRRTSMSVCRPFDSNQLRNLLESMAGRLPEDAWNTVAHGWRMAVPLWHPPSCAAWLKPEPCGLPVQAGPSNVRRSRTCNHPAKRRVHAESDASNCSPMDTLRVISIGAVLGREFSVEVAGQLAEVTPPQTLEAVRQARVRHLIWPEADGVRSLFSYTTRYAKNCCVRSRYLSN
jgi:hypothetical protein